MIQKTDRETARVHLSSLIVMKRNGNWALSTEDLWKTIKEYSLTAEEVGTDEAELERFRVADCRDRINKDLDNWHMTDEPAFAKGVIENLQNSGLSHEEFGITLEVLQAIRSSSGLT